MGACGKSAVPLRKRSGSAGTPRRDALSPRAAHPRLFQSHVADAPTTASRRVPRPPHHILRLPAALYSSANIRDALFRYGDAFVDRDNPLTPAAVSALARRRVVFYLRA